MTEAASETRASRRDDGQCAGETAVSAPGLDVIGDALTTLHAGPSTTAQQHEHVHVTCTCTCTCDMYMHSMDMCMHMHMHMYM